MYCGAPHGRVVEGGGWFLELEGMSDGSHSVAYLSCFTPNLAAWTTVSTCGMGTSYPPGYRPSRMLSI